MDGRKRKHTDALWHAKKVVKPLNVLRPLIKRSSVPVPTRERPRRHPRGLGQYSTILPDMSMPAPQSDNDDDYIPNSPAASYIDFEEEDYGNRCHENSALTTTTESPTPSRQAPKLVLSPIMAKIFTEEQQVMFVHGRQSGLSGAAIERHLGCQKLRLVKRHRVMFALVGLECDFSDMKTVPQRYTPYIRKMRGAGALPYLAPRLTTGPRELPILEKFGERGSIDILDSVGGSLIVKCDYLVQSPNCFVVDSVRSLINKSPYDMWRLQSDRHKCKYPTPYGIDQYDVPRSKDPHSVDIMGGNYVFDA